MIWKLFLVFFIVISCLAFTHSLKDEKYTTAGLNLAAAFIMTSALAVEISKLPHVS